jgi:transposase
VPVKTIHQQSLTALHRLRSQWIQDRTARINGLRGFLREFGLFIPVGAKRVVPAVRELIEEADSPVPHALRHPLDEACREIRDFEKRIKAVETQLRELAQQMPEIKRVQTVPGVGLLTATAMVAFIGDAKRFPTSRHFAAFLGLTPKETSSGAKRRMGRISKRGDNYLRTLLVQGASTVLLSAPRAKQPDCFKEWAVATEKRIHRNKAACAVANKMARMIWAVWTSGENYRPIPPKTHKKAA